MQLLVQMRCQSKGQISAAILTSNNSLCLYENRRYITENTEEWIAPSANVKLYYYIPWMFINIYMCYGLNIVLNWIVWTLCSVTTPFLLEFYGSVDYQEAFICEFLQFCYCLFGCWWSDKDTDCTCCVNCILKCLTSFESEESQLSRDI